MEHLYESGWKRLLGFAADGSAFYENSLHGSKTEYEVDGSAFESETELNKIGRSVRASLGS
jgi:hypothetical protein